MQLNNLLLLTVGLLCLLVPHHIAAFLPYILGGIMAASGFLTVLKWTRQSGEEKQNSSLNLARGFLLLVLGLSFVIQGRSSLVSLGIAWAIFGIIKSVNPLICLINSTQDHRAALKYIFEFMLRLGLALLLLFDPYGKFTPHLRILGLELIAVHFHLTGRKKTQAKENSDEKQS
ncbi:MAG: DUF308 domain-containing protein [Candidatus Limivicinus sp.]|jgi:uncharacterized membrane protein HdeD (DUF308 family)